MAASLITLACALVAVLLFSSRNLWRVTQTWKFLLRGRVSMLEHARRNPHQGFSMPIPGIRLHVMSSKDHWEDLNNAQTSSLSPNAASREMFQPKYTFGFDWAAPREHVSLATVRSIRNMTNQLPSFQGRFVSILDQEFRKALETSPKVDGWARVPLWTTIQRAVTRINSLLLLGQDVADDDEFTTRGLNFVNQTTMILESVRIFPSFLAPVLTKMIKGSGREQQYVFKVLRELVAKREELKKANAGKPQQLPDTFLEGVIDYCQDDRSTQQNVDSINSTWVISTLAIPVVSCQLLQDVYTQDDYFESLRKECQNVPLHDPKRLDQISAEMDKLSLLEAFAMESWRTKCFQSNTVHRIAMKPFEFSDGYKVPAGDAIEFNQQSLMTDESLYPEHKKFDPSRFLEKNRSVTDTGYDWPFWGVPRYICPGRWHVANVEKLLAVYLLQTYDAKLESTKDLNFEWRDALVPNPKTILLMKPRAA